MRVKWILNLALGLFVVVAVALVAWQAISGRVPAASTPAPALSAASAGSVPSLPDKAVAAATAATTAAVAVPHVPDARVDLANEASPSVVAKAKSAPAVHASEPARRGPPPSHVRKVVATYFHGNIRCVTCRKIEAQAQEAVNDAFEQEIAAGTVEFRAVNVEEDANRHFIQDYQLVTKTLVVTEEMDGTVARWSELDNVWTLVNDRSAFFRYVQGGVRGYLETQ